MNSRIARASQVCNPAEQTQDMKLLNALSDSTLHNLLSKNVATARGRLEFVKIYNEIGFAQGKLKWGNSDEEEANKSERGDFAGFMEFKRRFDSVNTLMFSMEEGNHRSICVFFTYALRKVHSRATISEDPPEKDDTLTMEYLLDGCKWNPLKEVQHRKDLSTAELREMIDSSFQDDSPESNLNMIGSFCVNSRNCANSRNCFTSEQYFY